jgi:hypothetical protein
MAEGTNVCKGNSRVSITIAAPENCGKPINDETACNYNIPTVTTTTTIIQQQNRDIKERIGRQSSTLVKDGDSIAIGGSWLGGHPMAIIREIIRSKIKNLTAITVVGSIDIDLLIGAGCLKKLMFSFVSMEHSVWLPISAERLRRRACPTMR